jgi:hypothetical protein
VAVSIQNHTRLKVCYLFPDPSMDAVAPADVPSRPRREYRLSFVGVTVTGEDAVACISRCRHCGEPMAVIRFELRVGISV